MILPGDKIEPFETKQACCNCGETIVFNNGESIIHCHKCGAFQQAEYLPYCGVIMESEK